MKFPRRLFLFLLVLCCVLTAALACRPTVSRHIRYNDLPTTQYLDDYLVKPLVSPASTHYAKDQTPNTKGILKIKNAIQACSRVGSSQDVEPCPPPTPAPQRHTVPFNKPSETSRVKVFTKRY